MEVGLTKRKMLMLVAGVATVAVVLVGASILTGSKGLPAGNRSELGGNEPSVSILPSGAVTPSNTSDESTASRPSTSTPRPAAANAGASAPSPVVTKKPLPVVEGAPARTLALVESSAVSAGDSYTIVFVPYGYAPSGKGRSLAVRIERSTPVGTPKKPYPLEGRNVLLDTSDLKANQAIKVGGRYSGTVVFVPRGSRLALNLRAVR